MLQVDILWTLYEICASFQILIVEMLTKHQWYTGSEMGKALYEAIGHKERTATWVPHSITTDQTQLSKAGKEIIGPDFVAFNLIEPAASAKKKSCHGIGVGLVSFSVWHPHEGILL